MHPAPQIVELVPQSSIKIFPDGLPPSHWAWFSANVTFTCADQHGGDRQRSRQGSTGPVPRRSLAPRY
jgi:hypothetical protein